MKFSAAEKQHITDLIEGRLVREQRLHERALQAALLAERDRHAAEVETLRSTIRRLESERGTLQRLADKWLPFRVQVER